MAFPQNWGPCNVTYKANDLGESFGDVVMRDTLNVKDIMYNQKGDGPADGAISGRVVEVDVPMANTTFAELNYVMQGVSGAPGSLAVGNAVGTPCLSNAGSLILTLIEAGAASPDNDDIVTLLLAFPVASIDWGFSADGEQRVVMVTFKIYPNPTSGLYYTLGTA